VKRSQLLILALAVTTLLAAVLLQRGETEDAANEEPKAPGGAIAISFPYSPEKEDLLKPLIRRFNVSEPKGRREAGVRRGRENVLGQVEEEVADGALEPVASARAIRGSSQAHDE
jgi:Ca-activated chloride channel homolog